MMDTSPEAITERVEKAQASRRRAKNPTSLVQGAVLGFSAATDGLIVARLEQMPVSARQNYIAAMRGKSRAAGIKAFCQMCIGYGDEQIGMRRAIRDCTDPACPLYVYRPYQEKG